MGEQVHLNVKLIAHTQLSHEFLKLEDYPDGSDFISVYDAFQCTDGQAVALTAIRTCYSTNKPSEIIALEGEKYFGRKATDGKGGTDADRLFRQIVASKHTSTMEHITFTFAIEGISRACLAQLTRHRVGFSYSVQSQRFVKFGSGDKTGGFDYVIPKTVSSNYDTQKMYMRLMQFVQVTYDKLREYGVPAEDARMVLPQAALTNLIMTTNLRALLDFYSKRHQSSGAQWEIAELAERLREEVVEVEPWLDQFFEKGGS